MSSENCPFCVIVKDPKLPHIVYEDEKTIALMDLRQFHPGHVLVMPKKHIADIRDLDSDTGAALMAALSRITKAVSSAFPNEGITIWHSIGPAAFQEVPHLHIHVHPRKKGDDFQKLYPHKPETPGMSVLTEYAVKLKAVLGC